MMILTAFRLMIVFLMSKQKGEKKCDYLIYSSDGTTHLFELKGTVIDKAFEQLKNTLPLLDAEQDLSELVKNRSRVDAYIVSPMQITYPQNISSQKRMLAQKLSKRCSNQERPKNILDLVKFVKVIPGKKSSKIIQKEDAIICPYGASLEL